MAAILALLLSPLALGLALLGVVVWLSFRVGGRGARRTAAAASVVLAIGGSLAFLAYASADDFNDYPGYTCSVRDGHVPDGFPAGAISPSDRGVVSRFHPDIAWSHEYEAFPAGVRCTYWAKADPSITVVTHSPWAYTVWVYGLLALAFAQAVRVVNPDLLARPRSRRPAPL